MSAIEHPHARRVAGDALIQLLVAFAVLIGALGLVLALRRAADTELAVARFDEDLSSLILAIGHAYRSRLDYAGLDTASAIADGLAPPRMIVGTRLATSYGADVSLASTDAFGDGQPNAIAIGVAAMPAGICHGLLLRLPGRVHSIVKPGGASYPAERSTLERHRDAICDGGALLLRSSGA